MGDLFKGGFLSAFSTFFNTASSAAPWTQDSATQALAVWRSNHSAKSHPCSFRSNQKGGGGSKFIVRWLAKLLVRACLLRAALLSSNQSQNGLHKLKNGWHTTINRIAIEKRVKIICYFRRKMSLAAARPLISVYSPKNEASGSTVCLPAVFRAPIRPDIVSVIHNEIAKNRRQPYCVSEAAGHQTSAESWGRFFLYYNSSKPGTLKFDFTLTFLRIWYRVMWRRNISFGYDSVGPQIQF